MSINKLSTRPTGVTSCSSSLHLEKETTQRQTHPPGYPSAHEWLDISRESGLPAELADQEGHQDMGSRVGRSSKKRVAGSEGSIPSLPIVVIVRRSHSMPVQAPLRKSQSPQSLPRTVVS